MIPNALTNVNKPYCKVFNLVNLAHNLTLFANVLYFVGLMCASKKFPLFATDTH